MLVQRLCTGCGCEGKALSYIVKKPNNNNKAHQDIERIVVSLLCSLHLLTVCSVVDGVSVAVLLEGRTSSSI